MVVCERGSRILNFLQKHWLYSMSSFFDEKPQPKRTSISPDGNKENEIHFFISNKKEIIDDVPTLNIFSWRSGQRILCFLFIMLLLSFVCLIYIRIIICFYLYNLVYKVWFFFDNKLFIYYWKWHLQWGINPSFY